MEVIEFFAGARAVCFAFQRWGVVAVPFDVNISNAFDLTSAPGMALALLLITRLAPLGFVLFAPVCVDLRRLIVSCYRHFLP